MKLHIYMPVLLLVVLGVSAGQQKAHAATPIPLTTYSEALDTLSKVDCRILPDATTGAPRYLGCWYAITNWGYAQWYCSKADTWAPEVQTMLNQTFTLRQIIQAGTDVNESWCLRN